jgi:hypothetical protein
MDQPDMEVSSEQVIASLQEQIGKMAMQHATEIALKDAMLQKLREQVHSNGKQEE